MMFEFHREALVEFEAAADFYAECQAGLEIRFIDAVHAAISLLTQDPRQKQVVIGHRGR
jgi:hypothetical protein